MRRGTTPTNRFKTKVDLRDAEVAYMTYAQDKEVVFEKTKDDFDITEITEAECGEEVTKYMISIKLTQNDTLSLDENKPVEIQCRARFADGSAPGSTIARIPVERILKEGVI